MNGHRESRRRFLELGLAVGSGAVAGLATSGCQDSQRPQSVAVPPADVGNKPLGADLEKWKKLKGTPYEVGEFNMMPGVCQLPGPLAKRNWPDRNKYKDVKRVPGMCQLCSTVCGIVGYVKHGRVVKIEGNPNDPNSRGHLCARGQAGLNHLYHPERLLYPLRRVGKRGEGKWKRISWDEALDEIATRLKVVRESGKPEEFAFHQGRQRSKDALARFLNAFGTKTQLSHRALCSGNRRAANLTYLWESDWDLNDVEHSKYILNFGSNAFEAHQGHVPFSTRIQNGRFKNGAKLVTFDVRLSNTAGGSDEWFAPFPGTDGAIALAMCHVILDENLYDADFIDGWTNVTVDELRAHVRSCTPKWAEQISGVAAKDIRRIAIEFAQARPACTTMCNRGSSAHINGFYNDRAINLLNAIVGSVGRKGGWCWSPWSGLDPLVKTPPMPPGAKTWSVLEDPPEYPLANVWRRMRVGEVIYLYLLQGRAKLQAYMTYNLDSPLTWPEESLTQQVLTDEDLINFHVCINCFYNETAHYADIVLPWATYMERWDLDARGSYNLKPYVGLRTPMIEPLGESKDVREFFPELARRIGGGMEQWYKESIEEYMEQWASNVPQNPATGKRGLDRLLEEGAWEGDREPFYEPYNIALSDDDMDGASVDETTGVITKDGVGIGIIKDGKPVRGFATPSRRFEVRSLFVQKIGRNEDCSDLIAASGVTKTKNRHENHNGHEVDIDQMPIWFQPQEHRNLAENELVMTSFKWNVHNHGRTMNLKWLAEIVHSNPAWINPQTASRFGLKNGDWIEITSYYSQELEKQSPHLKRDDLQVANGRRVVATMRVPIVLMEGIHPQALAMSNSCGHWQYTNVAQARRDSSGLLDQPNDSTAERSTTYLAGSDPATYRDADWERNMWWQDTSDGDPARWTANTGNGWNQNRLMPITPDPISGQQAYHDTVISIKKVGLA
ncbi:MAG: molybdopterin-dependent oxidoreductase [Fuerstiella sp.]|nr:molybdopterin-dependent oxidoreductase [Fuerstiella sp.]